MIPKIIHHVWPGSDPFKEKFFKFRKSWLEYHPDWTFYFWRLDNLPSNINSTVLEILSNSKYSITVKSDILRFEVVKIFGGIYVDTDMLCLSSFDKFLSHKFFTGKECCHLVCPSLFGSVKENKLLNEIIDKIIYSIKNTDIDRVNKYTNDVTGPRLFTDVLQNKPLTEATIYSSEYFYPISWANRNLPNIYNNYISSTSLNKYAAHYWSGEDEDGWRKVIKFNT